MSANARNKKTTPLGQEVRRLRLEAGDTLRGLAKKLSISPAHLSDIEHDRRRPSENLLRRIAHELRAVGATFASLEVLITGIDPQTREWAASTPGARALLRKVLGAGADPLEILRALEKGVARNGRRSTRRAQGTGTNRKVR
jgi:transcriptional regulator with XRE-family HTH domain